MKVESFERVFIIIDTCSVGQQTCNFLDFTYQMDNFGGLDPLNLSFFYLVFSIHELKNNNDLTKEIF